MSGSIAQVQGAASFTGGDFKVTDQGHNGEFDVDTFKVQVQSTAQITGSLGVTGGITGSLLGTASFATSASYALTATSASYSLTSTSASYSNTSTSASYALSASFAPSSFDANSIYSYTFLLMGA
jgi:hypothetical protein